MGRYRNATTLLALLLVAGVTIGFRPISLDEALGRDVGTVGQTAKDGDFDTVRCRNLKVRNEDGTVTTFISHDEDGNGTVRTYSPEGQVHPRCSSPEIRSEIFDT